MTFTATGYSSNLLVFLRDLSDTVLVFVQMENGIGSVSLDLAPGVHSVVAVQWNIFMQVSPRTGAVAVRVLPPPLEVDGSQVPPNIFRLSGSRADNASIHVTDSAAPGGQEWVVTTDPEKWQADAIDWKPGTYRVQVHQCVPGGVSDLCSLPTSKDFTISTPVPTLDQPEQTNQTPYFSGRGNVWSGVQTILRIYINGATHPDVPDAIVEPNRSWSITAQKAFAPGEYSVTARQLVNGLQSKPTEPRILIIPRSKPMPPEIETVSDDGRVPTISGKGISGARLKLVYSDDNTEHPIEIRNGLWSFQRADKPLAPGRRSVRAWQEVDGLASESVSRDFVVVTPQPEITLPRQDDQVGADTDVVGSNAVAGAVMKIYDYISEEVLNSAPMTVDHEESGWQVALKNLPFGRHHIFAVQDYEGQSSKPSEPYRSFDVILQPPQIDDPEAGTHVPSTSVFNGKARAFALIELRLKGAAPEDQIEHVYADEKGEWNKELTLPLGPCSVRAKQSIDDQESVFTEPRSFTVVPRTASIETPADQEPVESQCVISGFADSPGTVTVALSEDLPPLGTVPVKDDGTWSTTVSLEDAPAGIHSLITRLSQQGFDSHWSPPRSIVLRKHPPLTATPDQGSWLNNRVMFAGKALPAAVIEVKAWFNPDIDWAPKGTQAGASGDWSVESETDLVPGPNRAIIRQRYVDEGGQEQISEAEVGERFEVIPDNEGSFGIGSSLQVNHSSTATLTGRES